MSGLRLSMHLACAAVWLTMGAAMLSAAAETAPHPQAEQLVRQLGDSSFRQRQLATLQLRKIGVPAKAALLEGLRDPDAEIRDRCRVILVEVLEKDYQMRVDAFEADSHGSAQHDLPCWKRFRSVVGETPAARALFVDMQRSESKLLEMVSVDLQTASAVLGERCEDLQQITNNASDSPRQISLGSLAAMFFVASNPEVAINDRISAYLHNFSYQPAMRLALSGGAKTEPLKRVIGAWVTRTAGSTNAYPGLRLSMQYDLPEGLEPAMNIVRQRDSQAQFLQWALLVAGRFGNRQHLAAIEPLLENSDSLFVHSAGGSQMHSEVRDVALAVLVQLSGQELKDYGLGRVEREPRTLFNISTIGFPSKAARNQAIEKWKAWSAAHKPAPHGTPSTK